MAGDASSLDYCGRPVRAGLVGVGGSRWLSNEVDKKLPKEKVNTLATLQPVPLAKAAEIATAHPAKALQVARDLANGTS